MKGGLTQRVVGWGVSGVLFFTCFVLLFGAATANSFGTALFAAMGDGIHVIVQGLPVMAEHIKGAATGGGA